MRVGKELGAFEFVIQKQTLPELFFFFFFSFFLKLPVRTGKMRASTGTSRFSELLPQ